MSDYASSINIPYDFPQNCVDGTKEYGDCREHGGIVGAVNNTPSVKTQVSSQLYDIKNKLTENEKIGIFISATLIVLYFLNKK